ncbi:MAG TPA: hypothetical protein VF416_11655 [Marmoricola sp.]
MAANDYYDFNPSATTWAILLTGFVVFVVALSVVLIWMVDRGQANGPVTAAKPVEPPKKLPAPSRRGITHPPAAAS